MRRDWLLIFGLVLLTFACFGPVGSFGFIGYDDYDYVYQNSIVRSGLNLDSITWSFTGAHAGNWHPVTWLSHILDCELFGLDPQEEHWVNLGFHAVNTALLFWWLRGVTGARWRSFLVAALFAVHPLHVQSVAWISERKDVLSGFFFMLILLAYSRYVEEDRGQWAEDRGQKAEDGGWRIEDGRQNAGTRPSSIFHLPSSRFYWLALVMFALGLMAKPMLVTVPFVLLILDFWPLRRFNSHESERRAPPRLAGCDCLPTGRGGARRSDRSVHGPGAGSVDKGLPPEPDGHSESGPRPSSIRHSPFAIRHSPFAIRHSPFVIRHSGWRLLLIEKTPFFLLSLASCLVTLWAQNTSGAMHSMRATSLWGRCLHALVSYNLYLAKMFWPVNLSIYYPLSLANPSALAVLGSLLVMGGLCLAAFWWRQDRPWWLAGYTWFVVMLLPVIGLVQVGLQAMADRYAYLPSIGLFIAVVWGVENLLPDCRLNQSPNRRVRAPGLQDLPENRSDCRSGAPTGRLFRQAVNAWPQGKAFGFRYSRWLVRGLFGIVVLLCVLDSRYQLRFWRNNITLFQHSVEVSPKNNFLGYFYLGISYGELGELDSAARCLTAALTINPDFELAQSRLGNVLLLQKKYAAAQPWLETVAKAHPNNYPFRVALGMALAGQRKYLAAQSEYQAAQQLNPNGPAVNQLLTANAPKAAAEQELSALNLLLATNSTPELHGRAALAQSVLGRYTEAVQQYKLALAQKPDSAECLNNLAWLLSVCPEATIRNGSEAVSLARHACALTQYQKTVYLGTLAAAYAEAGQFEDAVASATRACDRARAEGGELLEINQRLLTLYQNHQAYHAEDGL